MSNSDLSAVESRWRNYQQLIWTQQQIHLQIQQQQQQQYQNQKMNSLGNNGPEMPPMHHPPSQQQSEAQEKTVEDMQAKEAGDPWENFDAHAAFLGPNLWDKRVPYDGQDFKLEYMDLEEFLNENGIPTEPGANGNFQKGEPSTKDPMDTNSSQNTQPVTNGGPVAAIHSDPSLLAGPSRVSNVQYNQQSRVPCIPRSRSPSPSGSASSGISQDIGSESSPEGSQSGGSSFSFPLPFSVADVALGTVPGHDFDPRTRAFTEDELKPQPMVKKSRKQFVPDEAKDQKYWARRRKNNLAAKRSRDARRVKENQIAMRACYLEKENIALKQEIERVQKENTMLKDQLQCYRREQ